MSAVPVAELGRQADRPPAAIDQAHVDDYFQRFADDWRVLYERPDVIGAVFQDRRRAALEMIDGLRLPAGTRVLEVGCGAGLLTLELARRGFSVEATDTNPAMLDLTARALRERGGGDRVRVGFADAHRLELPDRSFGLVVALGVVPWLHSPATALAEMRRVLEPGGHLVVTADNRLRLNHLLDPRFNPALKRLRNLLGGRERRRGGSRFDPAMHTPRELTALVTGAGFEPSGSRTIGFGPFSFWAHPLLPGRAGVGLHRRLQRWADGGLPPLRATGAHCLVRAARPRP